MPANDFLSIATGVGAYVDTQVTYAGSGYQVDGLQPGITLGRRLNKCLRQGSVGSAIWGQLVNDIIGQDFLDDGDFATQVARAKAMLNSLVGAGSNPVLIPVPFSANPNFDCTAGNPLHPVFRLRLTGNAVSSTISGLQTGMLITIEVEQDGTGGWTFIPPVNVPMDNIDTTANQINVQSFHVLQSGSPAVTRLVAAGPMVLAN